MIPTTDAPDQALLVLNRLQGLGVSNSRDRDLLLARLQRQARPDEGLVETLERRLCEWLSEQTLESNFAVKQKRSSVLAGAEAAIVLSGIAERWPLALFDTSARLSPEALRRLQLAVPVAAPPVLQVAMPVQPLEPISLRDAIARPQALRVRTR